MSVNTYTSLIVIALFVISLFTGFIVFAMFWAITWWVVRSMVMSGLRRMDKRSAINRIKEYAR